MTTLHKLLTKANKLQQKYKLDINNINMELINKSVFEVYAHIKDYSVSQVGIYFSSEIKAECYINEIKNLLAKETTQELPELKILQTTIVLEAENYNIYQIDVITIRSKQIFVSLIKRAFNL